MTPSARNITNKACGLCHGNENFPHSVSPPYS